VVFFKKRPKDSNVKSREASSVADKHLLQYTKPGHKGECELVIGLDFGTSASKVVIQAPDLPGRPSFAVDFGSLSYQSRPYLLPTKLWMTPDKEFSLRSGEGTQPINDIKIELFSKDERFTTKYGPTHLSLPPQEIAAIYLALLLRHSRKWFLETKRDYVREFKRFRWSLNLGVPSPCIEDNEENKVFQRVGKAAWMLSTLEDELITLESATTELKHVDNPKYWENYEEYTCDFDIIPEIAAGAVGYALSNLRREGLHVMVDIGASTVDVCSFRLQAKEGSNSYALLIADVKQLGTVRLYNERVSAIKRAYEIHTDALRDKHDPMAPIKEDIKPLLLTQEQLCLADEEAKARFKEELNRMLWKVIWQTKSRRDPDAPVWRKGKGRLPILLIGGGSKLPFFSSIVNDLDNWLKHNAHNNGAVLLDIPVPDSLTHTGKQKDDNLFLAVTWGLSHRAMDVGDIIPADRIKDADPPRKLDVHGRFIGKEMV
jgi:hypothetical protein